MAMGTVHQRDSGMQSSPRIEELRQKFHENPRRYFAPLANEYRKAGDPEQAIAICRAHLAQQPGHMSGHVVYAQALYDARRTEEARQVFHLALALDPENIIVLRHLGDIARQRGEVEEARKWYSRALDGDPQDAEVAAYLAELTEPLVSGVSEDAVAVPLAAAVGAGESPVSSEDQTPTDDSPYLETEEATTGLAEPATIEDNAPVRVEVDRRLTPTVESSPIVTRTLAELYLNQGHVDSALDIYLQLAEQEPEDAEIQARVKELAGEQKPEPVSVSEEDVMSVSDEPPQGTELDVVPAEVDVVPSEPEESPQGGVLKTAPREPQQSTTAASEAGLMEEAAGAGELADGVERPEGEIDETSRRDKHFTEQDISPELWDTADFWGAGYFDDAAETDETFGLPLASDVISSAESEGGWESAVEETPSHAETPPPAEPQTEHVSDALALTTDSAGATAVEAEDTSGAPSQRWDEETAAVTTEAPSEGTTDVTSDAASDVVSEETAGVASEAPSEASGVATEAVSDVASDNAAMPEMVESESADEVGVPGAAPEEKLEEPATAEMQERELVGVPAEEPSPEAAATERREEEEEPEAVAPPKPAPPQVTVREFFATLGSVHARRGDSAIEPEPPSSPEGAPETVLPDEAAAGEQEYSFADDAFSNLFSNIQVSAEDSRAAVALSGAVAHHPPASTPRAPTGGPPSGNADSTPAGDEPAHESEEEIRRFREWLDGLAES
jgi:tetratricopeptide (TPR) repeat protein